MGQIEAMAIPNVMPSGVIPFGSAVGLWVMLVSLLLVSAAAIWLAVPRTRHTTGPRLVRSSRQATSSKLLGAES
jgi:hypothetical protein